MPIAWSEGFDVVDFLGNPPAHLVDHIPPPALQWGKSHMKPGDLISGTMFPSDVIDMQQKLPLVVKGTTRVFQAGTGKGLFIGTCELPPLLLGASTFNFAWGSFLAEKATFYSLPIRYLNWTGGVEQIVLLGPKDSKIPLEAIPGWCDWRPWIKATNGDI